MESTNDCAIEFEILEFCKEPCRCSHQGLSAFITCAKCVRTAKGFLLERKDSAQALLDRGYIKFSNGNGWSLSSSGESAYRKVRNVMDKLDASAGLFMSAEQKAEYDEDAALRAMLTDLEKTYGTAIQELRNRIVTPNELRKSIGLSELPIRGDKIK